MKTTTAATQASAQARLERELCEPPTDPAPGAAGAGVRIRTARLLRGISQAQLGEAARVSEPTIIGIEQGRSWRGDVLERIAKALDMRAGELAGWL
ncbi:MAG TPA: helix-turn-helix transcriptional regulator [Thauera aminoaromatica]|nr:helix-turn-helix transcriptional regulator [Thauera aminoaromatica]